MPLKQVFLIGFESKMKLVKHESKNDKCKNRVETLRDTSVGTVLSKDNSYGRYDLCAEGVEIDVA